MIKNGFINIDTSLWENAIVRNFSIDRSAQVLMDLNYIAHIDLIKTSKDNHDINVITTDSSSAKYILSLVNLAITNLELYKKNERKAYFNYLVKKRQNRKFYQFWLNKSDDKLMKKVIHEFSWMGSQSDKSEYRHFINQRLINAKESLELYINLENPSPLTISFTKRHFALFLHFCTDESYKF